MRKLAAPPVLFALALLSFSKTRGEEPALPKIGTWLGKAVEGQRGRAPFGGDAFLEKWVETGEFPSPKDGEDGWANVPAKVDSEGRRSDVELPFLTGYAWTTLETKAPCIVLLRVQGHGWAAVNGKPLGGDIYRAGAPPLPVFLREGKNALVVRVARGPVSLSVEAAPEQVFIAPEDATLPDLRVGERLDSWGQVVITNPTGEPMDGLELTADAGPLGPLEEVKTRVPRIPALTIAKVAFRIASKGPIASVTSVALTLEGNLTHSILRDFPLRVRSPGQTWKETFRSDIDGSVQYFAVRPPRKVEPGKKYGLVLSLHGASVEATGQVDAYSPHEWCYVVAPTNRRPFGFDWEDWGRDDALEVLEIAKQRFPIDLLRVHLAGHSMGGHGTWHVGVTFPDRFACLSPSAGWVSFFSYAGVQKPGESLKRGEIFARCMGPSDTLSLLPNLAPLGVYAIHGDKDDNVPVTEARRMVEELKKLPHKDLRYHEEPGAGHWWSKPGEDGAACVDLADMFGFLSRHARDEAPRSVSFRTWNPGISSRSWWVEVLEQDEHLALSTIEAKVAPATRTVTVKTENIASFALDLAPFFEPGEVKLEVDGEKRPLAWEGKAPLRVGLRRDAGTPGWAAAPPHDPERKNPARYGPFKRALAHRFILVYGSGGTEAEKTASFEKARYDSQTWSYRANGSVEVLADHDFQADDFKDRGVVLYGNRSTNSAFAKVLEPRPVVDVEEGKARIGGKVFEGDDLACLYALPRKGSDTAMVAVVGGTGAKGMRLTMAAPYFSSGVAYPDFVVFDSMVLARGLEGVRACGILDATWNPLGSKGSKALAYFAEK